MSIKSIVLNNHFLRELFFLIFHKKINKRKLDKKIDKISLIKIKKQKRQNNLIVSLTSYGERLSDLRYTLYSLITQTVLPEKIIVWLDDNDVIPEYLRIFETYGVEFSYCENIKSYKKLIPTLRKFPNKCIITVDDDIFYNKNLIKKLWKYHIKWPDCKIAHIAHDVLFSDERTLMPYTKWKHNVCKTKKKNACFPTGVGGILYPTKLYNSEFLDNKLFTKLCPNADDVWFYFMGLLSEQKTIIVPHPYNHLRYVDIYKEYGLNNKSTLQSLNVNQNFNDVQIRNVMNHFHITDKQLYGIIMES